MSSSNQLGLFQYGEKSVLFEQTSNGYLVTLTNIDNRDPNPVKTPYTSVTIARRAFEQGTRRAISASITDEVNKKIR